jgi:hypothetical protein
MMNYTEFLQLATMHKFGSLTQERYESLRRASLKGDLSQSDFLNEWLSSALRIKSMEENYDTYKQWCWDHGTRPLDYSEWRRQVNEELSK